MKAQKNRTLRGLILVALGQGAETALHYAVVRGHGHMVQLLVEAAADINALNKVCYACKSSL